MNATTNLSVTYLVNVLFTVAPYGVLIALLASKQRAFKEITIKLALGSAAAGLMHITGNLDIWSPGLISSISLYLFILIALGYSLSTHWEINNKIIYFFFALLCSYAVIFSRIAASQDDNVMESFIDLLQLNGMDLAAVFGLTFVVSLLLGAPAGRLKFLRYIFAFYLSGLAVDLAVRAFLEAHILDALSDKFQVVIFIVTTFTVLLVRFVIDSKLSQIAGHKNR